MSELVDRMRERQVNPLIPIVVGVIVVLCIGYFSWMRPKMEADKALREFNTPEAQAKRDPDQKKVPAGLQSAIQAMRAKEQHLDAGEARRAR